ncbi:MAG: Hsp20/alpha crystallin family protein [Gemmatimonadaceae bacterium]|nr:Hsp20/alpha crystallin family protein [Gemmatimonadaceae bacterium]
MTSSPAAADATPAPDDDWIAAERELLGWSSAELKEHEGEYEVDIMLPGFTVNDIELTATPHELLVHAADKREQRGVDGNVVWSEFGSSEVFRRFALPTPVENRKISAELKNGMLTVHAPKVRTPAVSTPDTPLPVTPATK